MLRVSTVAEVHGQRALTCLVAACLAVVLCCSAWQASRAAETRDQIHAAFPEPKPTRANEPLARSLSLAQASTYLDRATVAWDREQQCASCHTTYAFLMARPLIADTDRRVLSWVRQSLEDRVAGWDQGGIGAGLPEGTEGISEVVATASSLAFHDATVGSTLHPRTRQALTKMWTLQRADGAWDWNKHELPPMEYDDYFGAVFSAVGVGHAPENYAQTAEAQSGVDRLRAYFRKHAPPNTHHLAWLLWASTKLDGLMSSAEQDAAIQKLLALECRDGGWNLPSLGDWDRLDGSPNDTSGPADGYGTGLIVYVLRQAGVSSDHQAIQRAKHWITTNQRASGRWFTRSVNADRDHYLTNAGTAFCVMALDACAEQSAPPK